MPVPQMQGLMSNAREKPSPRNPNKHRVFVYGTLKKGFNNHERFLSNAEDLGPATIEGLMFHLNHFPAISLAEKFSVIHGEVYLTDWEHVLAMDRLEGVGYNFYERIETLVEPHGVVWAYVFSRKRAEQEKWVVPSANWTGPDTVKLKWGGFGKGVIIGEFETNLSANEIKVGPGDGPHALIRSNADSTYKLINKNTGEVLGSYIHLRDMVGKDGRTKPVIRLPGTARRVESPIDAVVQTVCHLPLIPPQQHHPSMPIPWSPSYVSQGRDYTPPPVVKEEPKPEPIPQAARLLNLKLSEA